MFDETFVAGTFPAALVDGFPLVTFVSVPPIRHTRWDALVQREEAARLATGDFLVFCHDDHMPGPAFGQLVRQLPEDVDIIVPKRLHGRSGSELNNGRAEGYMGGHCYVMRRWIWAAIPLTSAPDEYWDTYLTPRWRSAGANIVWSDELTHYDCEATESEQ